MRTYENLHFGLRLEIPDALSLQSWKHAKLSRNVKDLYQTSDDAVPEQVNSSKFLFTAKLPSKESPAKLDALIELSLFKLDPASDFGTEMNETKKRENRTWVREGVWTVGGRAFGFVEEADPEEPDITFRFA